MKKELNPYRYCAKCWGEFKVGELKNGLCEKCRKEAGKPKKEEV